MRNQRGKNIKVFLSSTFKDMDAERDIIMNRVAPMLQERLAPEGITVQFIDLRWGVNTHDVDEDERENLVLRECISEIRQSRPFFIGLLGDRYGWVPSEDSWQVMLCEMTDQEGDYIRAEAHEQKSVTELEILFGALMDADLLRRSLFCFRKSAVYSQMDDTARRKFCNPDDETSHKLAALKQKIVTGCEKALCSNNIYEYDCQWDGLSLTGLDGLVGFLSQVLYQQILLYESSHEVQNAENEFQQLQDADQERIDHEMATFMACEEDLKRIEAEIRSPHGVTLIHGLPGAGKTALLCKLYQRADKGIPLIHFCRQDEAPADMLKKWLSDPRLDCQTRYGLEEKVSIEELSLQLLKAQQATHVPLYLFVDDLHLLKDIHKLMNSTLFQLGDVVMVGTIDEPAKMLFQSFHALLVRMPSVLNKETAKQVVVQSLKSVGKSLPAEVLERITNIGTSFPSYTYPLWLQLVIRKLTMLSAEDYEAIRQRGDGDEAITRYLLEMVDDIATHSPYIEPLFASIMFDAGKFLPFDFYWTMIRLLAASEYGLREEDFKQMFGDHWDQLSFSVGKRWLGNLLSIDGKTGRIDFAYSCYRRVLRHFCHDKDEGYASIIDTAASHFFNLYAQTPNDESVCREVAALSINLLHDGVLKAALSSDTAALWPYLVRAAVRLVSTDIAKSRELFSKVLSLGENGVSFIGDVAMQFYQSGNNDIAAQIAGIIDPGLMKSFVDDEFHRYNPADWEYEKMNEMLTLLHYSGFMFFADDAFLSTLLLYMVIRDSELLSAFESDQEDTDRVLSIINRFVNLWSGGDDELEEVDTKDFSPAELVDYAEQLMFTLFAPKHAADVLDQYEEKKGSIPTVDALDIRANIMRCLSDLNNMNGQSLLDYYDKLQPHLKSLPDNEAVLAACKFLLLWNIVRRKISDDRTSMYYRADEANQTFNAVLRVYEQGNEDSALLLQLCFYSLCSTSEYCIDEMVYRGEHEEANRAVQTLLQAVEKMKRTKENSVVAIMAYALAYSVFSNYFEQHGDMIRSFYYCKQHEYAVYMAYQRFPADFVEIGRRYAAALSETGWQLLTVYHQTDEADKNITKAMTIFKDLFDRAPTDLSADDLLKCAYRQMRTLRTKGLHEESIALGKECLSLVEGMESLKPNPQVVSMLHDEIGNAYSSIGDIPTAIAEIRIAAEGFKSVYHSDPDNENLMRSVIVNTICTARLLAFHNRAADQALEMLQQTEPIVKKALEQQPDSIKVRNIAINYYVCLAQVDMAMGQDDEAANYRDMIVGRLYQAIVNNQRVEDYPLLLDCLKQLFVMALQTKSVEMAEACASMEYHIKREFIEKRVLTVDQADLASTEERLQLVEKMKGMEW